MVQYTFELQLPSNPNNSCQYTLDLNYYQEGSPETVFTPEIKQSMHKRLEKQSSCKISPKNLDKMIKRWLREISEGHQYTSMSIELPTIVGENLKDINEIGNQELPPLFPPDLSEIEPSIGALPPLNFS
ncbi:MAG: hypothetical protein AB4426_04490 [Xenococcaceae cyanobacterium]